MTRGHSMPALGSGFKPVSTKITKGHFKLLKNGTINALCQPKTGKEGYLTQGYSFGFKHCRFKCLRDSACQVISYWNKTKWCATSPECTVWTSNGGFYISTYEIFKPASAKIRKLAT